MQRNLIYPSQSFLSHARAAFDTGQVVHVKIKSKWRAKLFSKAGWPKDLEHTTSPATQSRYFGVSTLALFSLFHSHIYAITAQYHMEYAFDSDKIIITYSK